MGIRDSHFRVEIPHENGDEDGNGRGVVGNESGDVKILSI